MLRILNAEPDRYNPEARTILCSLGELVEERVSQSALAGRVADFDVLIVRLGLTVDRAVLDAGRRLRIILSATTGLDHIDCDAARAKGIEVLSLAGETAFLQTIPATAEHTWALLLALVRRIPAAAAAVQAGRWDRDAIRGQELAGRRLGLIGFGRVGRQVARFGLAFDMEVSAYSPHQDEWMEGVERATRLEQLLRRSHVVSLHAPLTPETRQLIGARELAWLPHGALLVNTSRGALLDEEAVAESLRQGRLGGVAVDVLEGEREGGWINSPLAALARTQENVIITPHLGGATVESMARTELFMAHKLQRWCRQPHMVARTS